MTRTLSLVLLFGLLALQTRAAPAVYYLSPHGNDAWSGRPAAPNARRTDGPWATLAHARDAVRALKQKPTTGPVTVFLRGGTYFLGAPVAFTPGDSGTAACPITYSAYKGETPILSGGRPITGWHKTTNGLWRAKLPDVQTGHWYFRSLRVGQSDAVRARTPNYDPQHPHTGGWLFAHWPGRPWERGAFDQGVANTQNAGTELTYQVVVPAAGTYHVWLRYGHNMQAYGIPAMDGHSTLSVIGSASAVLNHLPDTGGWGRYRWSDAAQIALPAGPQTLTWENVKGGGINLDAFFLTDDSAWKPGPDTALPPVAAGRHQILIQAEACTESTGGATVPTVSEIGVKDTLGAPASLFSQIRDWDGAEITLFPAWGWVNERLPVAGADAGHQTLTVHSGQDIWIGDRFDIENVREALDSPGEWFLDRKTGELLYQPHKGDASATPTVAPVTDRLLTLTGDPKSGRSVAYLNFLGLAFWDTDYTLGGDYAQADAALWLSDTQHCTFDRCTFQHLGGYAVRMENGSSQNAITRCTMARLGEGGVILLGDAKTQPHDNLIAANDIHDCGRIYAHVAGVYVTTGSRNRILNNRIARMPRYGVSLKSYDTGSYSHDNIVAYNALIDTNLETNDTGAIETLGRDERDSGNQIKYNLIRNVVGLRTDPNGKIMTPFFTWGIYLDDFSSGTLVEGNIVQGTVVGAVCIHNGKDNVIENNIFLDGEQMNVRLQPHGDGFMHGNIFRRNIVAYHNPDALLWFSYADNWKRDILGECDHNLYWNTGGLDLATTPKPITPAGDWAKWQGAGLDTHSRIADPRLVDPQRGDFRLRPDSPAFALGFQRIPVERIGPQGYR